MLPRALPRVGRWGVGVAAAPLLVADLEVDGLEVDGEMGVMDMCQCVFCLQLCIQCSMCTRFRRYCGQKLTRVQRRRSGRPIPL